MKRAVSMAAAVSVVLTCGLTSAQEASESNYEHLKGMEWMIGEWEGVFTVPAGVPEIGPESAKAAFDLTCRWTLKKNFIAGSIKREVSGESQHNREFIGWDSASGKMIHWIFNSNGVHGGGEWCCDGNTWTLKWSVVHPDKTRVEGTSKLVPVDDNTFTWQITDRKVNGEQAPDLPKATMVRKEK